MSEVLHSLDCWLCRDAVRGQLSLTPPILMMARRSSGFRQAGDFHSEAPNLAHHWKPARGTFLRAKQAGDIGTPRVRAAPERASAQKDWLFVLFQEALVCLLVRRRYFLQLNILQLRSIAMTFLHHTAPSETRFIPNFLTFRNCPVGDTRH